MPQIRTWGNSKNIFQIADKLGAKLKRLRFASLALINKAFKWYKIWIFLAFKVDSSYINFWKKQDKA